MKKAMRFGGVPLRAAVHLGVLALMAGGATAVRAQEPAPASAAAIQPAHHFDVPALPLDEALLQLARQAGVEVYLSGSTLDGKFGNSVQGDLSLDEALQRLLVGSGFGYSLSGPAGRQSIRLVEERMAGDTSLGLPAMVVYGGYGRDEQGYDAIYSDDLSTVYAGKEAIERYKGAAPADVFKGMLNVYSGDARNSGALDPNVRGIQGPGRVPLTIDGTEQAITVWRGYNGATNRNYIDPNLLGGIKVIKGPNLERNVYSGVGGAVVAKTIEVDDILKEGEDFGGEIKIEGSNGSVAPRVPKLSTGMDYRDIPGFQPGALGSLSDPTLRVEPKTSSDNGLLSSDDYAYRLALGKRHEHFDVLVAYAYREKGNHFSGRNNAGYYSTPFNASGTTLAELNALRGLAIGFPAGTEVLNTSSKMESWLGKVTWKIDGEQKLSFGVRDTDSLYGEVMPSRIRGSGYEEGSGRIQWPLSHVDAKAYNLEYTWNPSGNRWIDFYSNLWFTDTRSDTYTAGGSPNYAYGASDPYIFNTAIRGSDNDRTGVTLSNRMKLLDSLDLTLGGNWQYEKLRSDGDREYDPTRWNGSWSLPRAGRRQEWEGNFNFNWQPVDRLTFTLGARYSSYWAFDDYLAEQQAAGNIPTTATATRGRVVSYTEQAVYTQDDWQSAYDGYYAQALSYGLDASASAMVATIGANQAVTVGSSYQKNVVSAWYHDGKGNYDRDDNPCTNGSLASVENCTVWYSETQVGGEPGEVTAMRDELAYTVDTTAKTRRGHAWTPAFSATYNLTDDSRVYFRYSEAKRYPSMFESTIGFSASQNIYYDIKPEHARNYELAYVHDLSRWLELPYADFKLAYYHHKTRDVIERTEYWRFSNIEQQTIRGAEMQARFDSGRFFGDLGLAYTFENRVCDEARAESIGSTSGYYSSRCVQDGFIGGYLLTQAIPEVSGSLTLGGRFMDNRLEVGSRIVYHKQHNNKDLDAYVRYSGNFGVNTPFTWDDLITYDAYVSYRFDYDLKVELIGTNLTDEYYVDPVTRSAVVAPGRTLKVALSANF